MGQSKVPVYAYARCWLEGEEGTGRREQGGGSPSLFRSQAPRFPLFQEGASSLTPPPSLTPLPPFPTRRASQKGAKWTRLGAGGGGSPPGTASAVHLASTLACHTQTKEEPAQDEVHGLPKRAPLGGRDEVAVSRAGMRLAWVTQWASALRSQGGGQHGKKGGPTVS